ncbi:DNA repair protein [Vibrio parahaemolyticus]|nr:DNA repair protein [Vibrio parahaemolyticus]EJG0302104.1 DNA repair protein [Vibrio parahaemolyticus]EJG0516604.1 DNA repair protein [Vibrio parahaemolyticus]
MRVGTKELYKIGLETLQHYEQEEYFSLFSYRKLLRPFLEAHYSIDEQIERFNNQSYRILKILEQERKVVRLSPPRVNNAQFVAVGGKKVTQEKHRVGQGYLEPEPVSEERQYQEQLNAQLVELRNQITAHKELLELFPGHSGHLNNEIEKLEREVLLTEYKKEIMGKIINQEKR